MVRQGNRQRQRQRFLVGLAGALWICGCRPAQPPTTPVLDAMVVLPSPPTNDTQAWKSYLATVVTQYIDASTTHPYLYYLPPSTDPDFADAVAEQTRTVMQAVTQPIAPGTLLAFGSPASGAMAQLVRTVFASVPPGHCTDVPVLFIGQARDASELAPVVRATGARYLFVQVQSEPPR